MRARDEPTTVASVFDQIADQKRHHLAVIDETNSVSYRDLQAASEAVARSLLTLNVQRGDRVACLMRNRWEWVACCLGVAKAGATFVPLNTWYRRNELAWTLRHTDAVCLLAEPQFLGHDYAADLEAIEPSLATAEPGDIKGSQLPSLRTVVYLDGKAPGALTWTGFLSVGAGTSIQAVRDRQSSVDANDPLFVLYTSGSTAEPKGVVLPQESTIVNGRGIGDRRGLDGDDRIWLGSPLFYGLGATNCLPVVLSRGATLVVQGRFHPEEAIRVIERHECSVFYGMSNMIRQIRDCSGFDRHRLRTLRKGTAGIERNERRVLIEEMGVELATQSYGATEVCGNCFGGHPGDSLDLKLDTCGQLLPGFEAKVVDPETGRTKEPGEVGLLKIRGHTALGYLNAPGLTAAAFDADGYYDTGDLGSIGADGYFRYKARVKEMVKTGGINVSPLEIEHLLLEHAAVREAYVVGVPDDRRGEVAVAFVVTEEKVAEKELQQFVHERAASFKVPARVVFLSHNEVPRTASGKVSKPDLKAAAGKGNSGSPQG